MAELGKRLALDLADALARDAELASDLLERARMAIFEAEAQLDDLAFAVCKAVEDLVKKGELTVQQGKSLNQELSRKAKEAAQETTDGALRAFLEALSDEDRAAYAAKVAQMAADIEAAKVTVDVEDGVEEEPAAQAESAEGSAE